MTPRQKAQLRAGKIIDILNADGLPAAKRKTLEDELAAIADNIAENCYSNDPDDGVDWSDCPGISATPAQKMGSM